MNQDEKEIWSEYFRVKNTLMDYDENLRNCIASIHMLSKYGKKKGFLVESNFLKAQRHVGMILDLALACGAFPQNTDKEKIEKIKAISKGSWEGIKDFDFAQECFREWYIETKFYNVAMTKPRNLAPHEIS